MPSELYSNREETQRYEDKIRQLQDNILNLRISRRILMTLLEQVQTEKAREEERLRKEAQRLQKSNSRYAGNLLKKNQRIRELEQALSARPELSSESNRQITIDN